MPGNSTVLLTRLNGDTSSTTFIDEGGNILTRNGVIFVDNPLSPFNDNCAYFNGKFNQTLEEFALANDVLEEFLLIFNKISVLMSEYVEASDVQSVIAKLNNIISEYVLASTSMEELMQTVIAVFGVITENIVVSADIDVFKKIFQLISESATVTTDLDAVKLYPLILSRSVG